MYKEASWYPLRFLWNRVAWSRWDPDRIRSEVGDTVPDANAKLWWMRVLVELVNRQHAQQPNFQYWSFGELRALEILNDIFRYVIWYYGTQVRSAPMSDLGETVERAFPEQVSELLQRWFEWFPPMELYRSNKVLADFLTREPRGGSNWDRLWCEFILGWINNENPAARKYKVLFTDEELRVKFSPYTQVVHFSGNVLSSWPPLKETNRSLWETLWEPIRACPDSLEAQLEYIRRNWAFFLPRELLEELEVVRGVIQEEKAWRGFGKGPMDVLDLRRLKGLGFEEYEAFSPDRDWMPNVVLIAKSVYVWLWQLSRKYGREIKRLDEIPDEELDQLARWGFTGLWLIGVWERSEASKMIKRMTGNPEALASAYSLYDYEIADDLGGEEALNRLKERAFRRGIRLASDMVPNHFGIYSRWVIEHPDWFIQTSYPPFPKYQFTGPNLSLHPDVVIQIEDGYWDRTDASVVFKWQNVRTGEVRYIYHGNDGTHMPWNDTAQLNFLRSDVREAVKGMILHVASMFPIIRFDAAMTLTKRHYQRLWYPAPGEGGAIPSRAEFGMSREEFDRHMPKEFWREVVDMVQQKAPDTLLLAEAFWLLEGYFVRTLGMHRVYNSAFMNMLKMEDNAKYRQTIKNVLEFSPPVLQRFVNFMNNPDEETAVAQFGKGDKYFGVAMMMVTLPGLPMFGHGQIEGFAEKYGMEYPRAYWDEVPDGELIRRHEREIFPLMRKRHLFSGAQYFTFYDFVTPEGWVDENVFAYSNRSGMERALILYNNAYSTTRGRIYRSTAINVGPADNPYFITRTLGEALQIRGDDLIYYVFREHRTGLEYVYSGRHLCEQGMFVELKGYEYVVFLDWREVYDHDGIWARIADMLGGKGVQDIDGLYREFLFADVLDPLQSFLKPEILKPLVYGEPVDEGWVVEALGHFWQAVARRVGYGYSVQPWVESAWNEYRSLHQRYVEFCSTVDEPEIQSYLGTRLAFTRGESMRLYRIFTVWTLLRKLGGLALQLPEPPSEHRQDVEFITAQWLKEWHLTRAIERGFIALGLDGQTARDESALVRICIEHAERLVKLHTEPWAPNLYPLMFDPEVQRVLGVHEYGGRTWMIKERWEDLLFTLFVALWLNRYPWDSKAREELVHCLYNIFELILGASETEYDYLWLFEAIK